MAQSALRIVVDTNTLLRALVVASSAAVKARRAAEERVVSPLLSKPVVDEYRAVLTDAGLAERFPEISPRVVEVTIRRLRFVGEYERAPKVRFEYPRDPRDEKFIEVAIGLHATHVVSADQDLLSLPQSRSDAGKRFRQRLPGVLVMDAADFVRRFGRELSLE